jgi:hypothetical protein
MAKLTKSLIHQRSITTPTVLQTHSSTNNFHRSTTSQMGPVVTRSLGIAHRPNVYNLRKSHFALEDRRRSTDCSNNENVIALLPVESTGSDYRETGDRIGHLFLPTVCSSCSKSSSWKTLSIKRTYIETWQPYLAMCAFLEGDLSLLGSSISMVHYDNIRDVMGAACVVRSVEVNPTPEAAAQVKPYLQSGFL